MPNAILCITGSELTRGETRDANGPFLATRLSELGVRVDEVALVPDDPALLAAAVRRAVERAEVVVLSGGLGPTADDHTVRVLAEVFGRGIHRHPEAEARMRARALARGYTDETIPANFYKQAEVIEGAEALLNPVGLAPGMVIPTARGLLAVLPGVPREMQPMFRDLVVPAIRKRLALEPPRILRAKVLGMGESWCEARVQRLGIDFARAEYGISAKPGELVVKFIAHRREDHGYLDEVRRLLEGEFGQDIHVLPEGLTDASGAPLDVEHSAIVHALLLASGITLSTAESCTGGMISKCLTDHAGSSAYFLGSVVAYHDAVKERLLGVPRELLERHGAVSAEVCEAMARGARRAFGSRLALAATGIAGPGGATAEKPVGLVYIGLAAEGPGGEEAAVDRSLFVGAREMVRHAATVRALDLLRRRLAPR
ncbi:MAG: CinA family nicotinamide mononucleotide deamidase-related protein [Planctomycetes bacterium]|nr:CinA family nicotinamide mononucleotide deamidase-related protein [Planctomycetota bacterium]